MKSYSNLISLRSLFLIMVVAQFASCSWIGSKRSLFGSDDGEESEEQSALPSVPRSQFDSLNRKYEKLLKERQMEKVEGTQASQMMNQMESGSDSSLIISDLEKVKNSDLAETVDVFAQKNKKSFQKQAGPTMPLSFKGGLKYQSPAMVEEHIERIRKAESLVSANKFDSALSMIKELEKSPIRQIVVRAKFLLGEVLFKQGEYDLSMQVFEEVLEQYAFSGLVIKTLGRLIVCSDKLKISAKQEKYYSILHDFFEQGS